MANNTEKKIKINISSKEILEFLALGGVLMAAIVAPNAVKSFRFLLKDKDYMPWKKFNRHRIRQFVGQLQKQGMIKRHIKGDQGHYILTEKGKHFAMKYNIDKLQLVKQKKWDNKWRIVIFDIPERKKIARDALRSKFLKIGMRQLQKSVFIYPFECKNEIDFVSDFFCVGEDILYMEANVHDVNKSLKRIFDL